MAERSPSQRKAKPRKAAAKRKPGAKRKPLPWWRRLFARLSRRSRRGKKPTAPKKQWRRRVLYWLAVMLVGGGIALAGFTFYLALGLPDTSTIPRQIRSPAITLLSQEGEILARRGNIHGEVVSASDLPPHVRNAVISIEDRRFFRHHGIDLRALLRAAWENARSGELQQGGSTITQQLAKNLFLTPERSMRRKIREALLAVWLEIRLSKEEIFSLYLNRVYFGAGAYGIDAAARLYFGTPARELSLQQAALLAGLLQAPSRYAPNYDSRLARERARLVISAMAEAGHIDAAAAEGALAAAPSISMLTGSSDTNYAADWLISRIPDRRGGVERDVRASVTLDAGLQSIAEEVVAEFFAAEPLRGSDMQIALVAMDGRGAVRAMVGGRSWRASRFNRAAQARRQPGSAFKPFAYLAAMERGFTPQSRLLDAPIEVEGWRPRNYGDVYRGGISLREAFAHSSNAVAVSLSEEVGRERVIEAARRLGIRSPLQAHPSLPLGVFEISPLELTAAYAPFANGGYAVSAHGIEELWGVEAGREGGGEALYRRPPPERRRVVAPAALRAMREMLRAVVAEGSGGNARLARHIAAGKTGTSQDSRDAWFIGFVDGEGADGLIATVWLGRDDGAPMDNIHGGGLPAEIWREFMTRAEQAR